MLRIVQGSACLFALLIFAGCGSEPPKSAIPSLNPQQAATLLHYNSKAEVWMIHVKKNNPTCEYKLDLPEQNKHPTEIDLNHIVVCGGQPAPMEFDASVSFAYDKDQKRWVITRFSS